jgi:hypothetical protein
MRKKGHRVNHYERPKRVHGDTESATGEVLGYEQFLKYSITVERLATALADTQEARWLYAQAAHDIEPPEILEEVLITDPQHLLEGLQEMGAAYSYIANAGRVPAETKNGVNWIPPIPPGVLAHLASLATAGDETFRNQAEQNIAKHQGVETQKKAEADAYCLHGSTCRNRRVTWPGRSHGPACWRHVTEDEKIELSALYDRAIQTLSCRACYAAIDDPCVEGTLETRINGYYSPIRSFNKRKMHKVRLDDYAETL